MKSKNTPTPLLRRLCSGLLAVSASLSLSLSLPAQAAPSPDLNYPEAPRSDVVDTYYGVQVPDPYRGLENEDDPATQKWWQAENKLTHAYLNQPVRAQLRQRLQAIWNYPRYGTPRKKGAFYYFWKNDGLQNQYVLYQEDDLNGPARVVLDPNTLSKDGTVSVRTTEISRDGSLLAYGLSDAGSDQQVLHFRDLRTGRDLPDTVPGLSNVSVDWLPDQSGVVYNRYPTQAELPDAPPHTHSRVYLHRLGQPASQDQLLYSNDADPDVDYYPSLSEDGRYLLLYGYRGTDPNNALLVRELQGQGDFQELWPSGQASFSVVYNQGPLFYVQTTLDAPRGRIVTRDIRSETLSELIPQQEAVLDQALVANRSLVAVWLKDAHHQLKLYDLQGKPQTEIPLPTLGQVGAINGKPGESGLFFGFSSFVFPNESFRYDLDTHALRRLRKADVKFDPERFATQQVFFTSRDGTKVPIFLVYRRDIKPDGTHPLLLYGYGGFNISMLPHFALAQIPWLEQGGVYAIANIRGGGEYGDAWHEAGMLEHKQMVFDDFMIAGDWLISHGWSHPKKLAIQGGSNGGLLTAACMVQRPDLYGAVISQVPVIDMLRYPKFTVGRFWIPEYGDAEHSEAEFRTLYAYSPLHNIHAIDYPPVLVMTADHDDRVLPAHAMKFVATLQDEARSEHPILLRVESRAGHGAGTPTDKILDEYADIYSFLFQSLGLEYQPDLEQP